MFRRNSTRSSSVMMALFPVALLFASSLGCSPQTQTKGISQNASKHSSKSGQHLSGNELVQFTLSNFYGLDWSWLKEGHLLAANPKKNIIGTHTTEAYIQGLLRLTRSRSKDDLKSLSRIRYHLKQMKSPGRNNRYFSDMLLAARLAVYDEATWTSFVHDFARNGRGDAALKDSLIPIMRNMPLQLRNKLYDYLHNAPLRAQLRDPVHAFHQPGLYEWTVANKRGMKIKCYKRRSDGECQFMAPKRCVDAFIRHTIRVEEDFSRVSQKSPNHSQVRAAYASYLNRQRELLFKDTAAGQYTAEDMLNMLTAVKKHVGNRWPTQSPHFKDLSAFGHGRHSFVLAFGSMINGRGILHTNPLKKVQFNDDGSYQENLGGFSDFDMFANPRNDLNIIHELSGSVYQRTTSKLAKSARDEAGLRARFQLDIYEQQQELNSSLLSPLSVRIDANGLYILLMHPYRYSEIPKSESQARNKKAGWRPFQYHRPVCFAVQGTCPSYYAKRLNQGGQR